METVQVTPSLVEFLDPFLGLLFVGGEKGVSQPKHHAIMGSPRKGGRGGGFSVAPLLFLGSYLCNHHVAVKRASAVSLARPINMFSNFGDDGSSESDVGDKVTIPRGGGSFFRNRLELTS